MSQAIVFWVAAPIALGSAIVMLWFARSPVHSALFLVLNLMAVAVLFIDLDAEFLGVVQFIIYAGAIMVLFLFVIMLLGVWKEDVLPKVKEPLVLASGIFAVALAVSLVYVVRSVFAESTFRGLAAANEAGNIQALGRVLFSRYVLPFEVTSILLIIAAIGAMILGRGRGEEEAASEIDAHAHAERAR